MKALVYRSPGEPAVVDKEPPVLGPAEVLIRSRTVGICHSDFELLEGRYTLPVRYPVTPGHEWSGEVIEVAADVMEFRPGDRVVGECVVGQHGSGHFGFTMDGAAAELFKVRAEWLHRMPDALTWQQGALVEPTSIGYNAVKTLGGVLPGDVVGVFGAGPIGLLTMLVAAANGASVVVIEPAQRRRALALELGARAAVDPTEAGFRDAVADLTSGRGFDGIVEASGSPAAMALALEVAAEHARLAYVGIKVGATTQATLGLIQSKALHIRGAVGSAGLWPSVIRLLASGTVDVGRIVTAAFPLTSALDALVAARDTARQIKVHIDVA